MYIGERLWKLWKLDLKLNQFPNIVVYTISIPSYAGFLAAVQMSTCWSCSSTLTKTISRWKWRHSDLTRDLKNYAWWGLLTETQVNFWLDLSFQRWLKLWTQSMGLLCLFLFSERALHVMGGQLGRETDWASKSSPRSRSSTLPLKSRYNHVRILFQFPSS